jgi:hypothetical protein
VRARSLGAVTGQRGSAGSARRRDPVSGVVLVIAVVLLGVGRALTRLGAALSPSQSPRWSVVCPMTNLPSVWMLCTLKKTPDFEIALYYAK